MLHQDLELLNRLEPMSYLTCLRPALERGSAVLEPASELEQERRATMPETDVQLYYSGVVSLLETGVAALGKLPLVPDKPLTADELLGLECLLVLYGRPPVPVDQRGELSDIPASWNTLADQREEIEIVQRAVGRIELQGHPELRWGGTGFLLSETCVVTSRRVAECFARRGDARPWTFRPGTAAVVDYAPPAGRLGMPTQTIRSVMGVHDVYEIAWLEVEPSSDAGVMPWDLDLMLLAAEAPAAAGNLVYLIGHPVRDSRHHVPAAVARIFDHVYGVKCIQPGTLLGEMSSERGGLLYHDCAALGMAEGSCLVDLETHQVLGLHLTNGYLDPGTAVPLWALREDPRMQHSGATFADSAVSDELVTATIQLRRLARSAAWSEIRDQVRNCYRRSFGDDV